MPRASTSSQSPQMSVSKISRTGSAPVVEPAASEAAIMDMATIQRIESLMGKTLHDR